MADESPEKKPETPPSAVPAPAPAPAAAAPAPAAPAAKPAAPAVPAAAVPAAAAPAAAPKPPPAKPPAKVYPPAKFNEKNGKLLINTRYWPTEKWKDPWSEPGYRKAAGILAGMIVGAMAAGAVIGEVSRFADPLQAFLADAAGWGLRLSGVSNTDLAYPIMLGVWAAIKVVIVGGVIIPVNGLFQIWWERKISAHIQTRLGPMEVGGWHGWLQTAADGIKLLLKEDITPESADPWVHRLAPAIVVGSCILAFAPAMFGNDMSAAPLDTGILYIFAIAGVSVMGIVMAGWGSGNKYSLLGGLRSAAQLVSYELPRTFSVVPIILLAGSLSLPVITQAQAGYWFGFFPRWFIFYPVVGQLSFLIFLIASVAETNRVPFDIPEAESELVAGFHTEYAGMKWSIFFLAEYGFVLLASCVATTFYLGGGAAPLPFLAFIPSWIWFGFKVLLFIFSFLWFRWTFPRFRVDRLMDFCWKFLLPWSFANIVFASLFLLR